MLSREILIAAPESRLKTRTMKTPLVKVSICPPASNG
jgi:hypothetical protein